MKIEMKRGFTLIELLVTIAIIALLTGIIMTNLTSSRAKARDAKRISDLSQIQLALELFFDRCRGYPPSIGDVGQTNTRCSNMNPAVTLGTFISKIPEKPEGGSYDYVVTTTGTDFILRTVLEKPSEVLKDSVPAPTFGSGDWPPSTMTCYDGVNDTSSYCLGPK